MPVSGGPADEPVVIIWDGLNDEERESAMRWKTTSKTWVLGKQQDSLSTIKKIENTVEGKLQSLLEERGWSLTGKEGKTKKGSKKIVERRTREPTESQKVNMGEKHGTKVGREETFDTKIGGTLDK